MDGILYLVATPIGNLADITQRALTVLKEVDLILAEDTRQTRKLLSFYQIHKPLESFHSYNLRKKTPQIIAWLKQGKCLALVSDSGTPGISDPGTLLVQESIRQNLKVEAIPGASALIVALITSGLPTDGFVFLGFLPRKKGKIRRLLSKATELGKTIIFYESPYRLTQTLQFLLTFLPPDIPAVVSREMTKKFAQIYRGTLTTLAEEFKSSPCRGEIVVLLNPRISLLQNPIRDEISRF